MEKSTTQGPIADLVSLSPELGRSPDGGPLRRAISPPIDLTKDDVTSLYERANALRENGQLDEAIAAYSRAHDLEPGSSEILNNLGDAFRARGRIGEAIVACRSAIALRPDFAEAHNNLGNALRDQGKYDEAIAAYTRAVQLRPDVHSIHNNLGIVLSVQGRLDEAMVSYATAIRLKPDYAKAHNNLGSVLRDKGRPEEAVKSCRRAIELKPDFAQAYNNLGVALASMGRFGDAVGAYTRALELQPQLAGVHQHLADAYRQTGQLANAITAYRRAIQLKPNNGMLYCNLGHALKDSGRIDEAIGAYIDSIRLKADSVEPYFNLGNALRDKGQYEQAADVYREALKLRPELATVHNHLGVVLNLSGRVNEAIDAFAAAVRLKPDYAKAYNNLGAALRDLGRYEEAVTACHKATVLKPDYAMGHYNLGKALKDMGRLDDAIAAYRAAVRLQPNLAEGYNNLGNAYRERGQLDEAIEAFARAVELKPNLAQARFNLDYARLEKTQAEKRLRGEIDPYELQPDPVGLHEKNPLPVEEPFPVEDVAGVVSDVPVEFVSSIDPSAAAEDVASSEPPAAAQDLLPIEESVSLPHSVQENVGPGLDQVEGVGKGEPPDPDAHDPATAILFEPPEMRHVESAAMDTLPADSGHIDDPRNALMADVSDVFVPPLPQVPAEPGEIDLLTFADEPDERPLPPVSALSNADFVLTRADEPAPGSVSAPVEASVESSTSVEAADRPPVHAQVIPDASPASNDNFHVTESLAAADQLVVTEPSSPQGIEDRTRESISIPSPNETLLTSDPFSTAPIPTPQPPATLVKSKLSRLLNFPSWAFASLTSSPAKVAPPIAVSSSSTTDSATFPPPAIEVAEQTADSAQTDRALSEPIAPIEPAPELRPAAQLSEGTAVTLDADIMDAVGQIAAEQGFMIVTADSAAVPVESEAATSAARTIETTEPIVEPHAIWEVAANAEIPVERTAEQETAASEARIDSAVAESESVAASPVALDAEPTPSAGVDVVSGADVSITASEDSPNVVPDVVEQSAAENESENDLVMATVDSAAAQLDSEAAIDVTQSIDTGRPTVELQAASEAPASPATPVEETAEQETIPSEPCIESPDGELESEDSEVAIPVVYSMERAEPIQEVQAISDAPADTLIASGEQETPASEPKLPSETSVIEEPAANPTEVIDSVIVTDVSPSLVSDTVDQNAAESTSEDDLVTVTADSAAVPMDSEITISATHSIDTKETIDEVQAASVAPTNPDIPIEEFAEREIPASEPGIILPEVESELVGVSPVDTDVELRSSDDDNGLSDPHDSVPPASNGLESFAPGVQESRPEAPGPDTTKANPDRQSKVASKASRRRNRRQAARARRNAARRDVSDGRELEDSSGSVMTLTAPGDPITTDDILPAVSSEPIDAPPVDVSDADSAGADGESVASSAAIVESPEVAQVTPTSNPEVHPPQAVEPSTDATGNADDSDSATDEASDDAPIGIVVSDLGETVAATDLASSFQSPGLTGANPEANSVTSTTAEFSLWEEKLTFEPVDAETSTSQVEAQSAGELTFSVPVEDAATTPVVSEIVDDAAQHSEPPPVEVVEALPVHDELESSEDTAGGEVAVLQQDLIDDVAEDGPSSIAEQELVADPEAFVEPLAKTPEDAQPLPDHGQIGGQDDSLTLDRSTSDDPVANEVDGAEPPSATAPEPVVEPSLPAALDECKFAAEFLATGKLNQTIASYRRALELWPALNEARVGLARVLEEKAKLADAVAACEVAVAARPDDPDTYCQLAEAQYKDEQFAEAVTAYQTAIRFHPNSAELYCKLGNVLRDSGKRDEARVAYRKALSLRSDFREAHNNLLDLAFRRR